MLQRSMTSLLSPFTDLPDAQLFDEVRTLSHRERHAIAQLIACLAEIDARRLYREEGCSSLFTYCTQVLHLSEHAAYGRIEAACAAEAFPNRARTAGGWVDHADNGLPAAPHLTIDNHTALLDAARHKSKREVEQMRTPKKDLIGFSSKCGRRRSVPRSTLGLATMPCALPSRTHCRMTNDVLSFHGSFRCPVARPRYAK